jgi:hypothetical protein
MIVVVVAHYRFHGVSRSYHHDIDTIAPGRVMRVTAEKNTRPPLLMHQLQESVGVARGVARTRVTIIFFQD